MKRQEVKDSLHHLADQVDNTSHGIKLVGELEDLIERIREEGLEGEARESGLKVTLAKGGVVPTGNTARGGVQTHRGGSDAVDLSKTISPPWMIDGQVGLTPAFPEGPRMEFPISGNDREIDIASVCVRALDSLPPEDRQRIARYLADRFEVS